MHQNGTHSSQDLNPLRSQYSQPSHNGNGIGNGMTMKIDSDHQSSGSNYQFYHPNQQYYVMQPQLYSPGPFPMAQNPQAYQHTQQ